MKVNGPLEEHEDENEEQPRGSLNIPGGYRHENVQDQPSSLASVASPKNKNEKGSGCRFLVTNSRSSRSSSNRSNTAGPITILVGTGRIDRQIEVRDEVSHNFKSVRLLTLGRESDRVFFQRRVQTVLPWLFGTVGLKTAFVGWLVCTGQLSPFFCAYRYSLNIA